VIVSEKQVQLNHNVHQPNIATTLLRFKLKCDAIKKSWPASSGSGFEDNKRSDCRCCWMGGSTLQSGTSRQGGLSKMGKGS
jgi:hypothetical protein